MSPIEILKEKYKQNEKLIDEYLLKSRIANLASFKSKIKRIGEFSIFPWFIFYILILNALAFRSKYS